MIPMEMVFGIPVITLKTSNQKKWFICRSYWTYGKTGKSHKRLYSNKNSGYFELIIGSFLCFFRLIFSFLDQFISKITIAIFHSFFAVVTGIEVYQKKQECQTRN